MAKKNLLPQLLEPIAIVVLLALFIIPTLTVINLSPITQENKHKDVLGVSSDDTALIISKVGGEHNIFKNEELEKNEFGEYTYISTITKRDGRKIYSKPILEVKNDTGMKRSVLLYGYINNSRNTNLSIMVGKERYVLNDSNNQSYTREITVEPGEKKVLYLEIKNEERVYFNQEFVLDITFK